MGLDTTTQRITDDEIAPSSGENERPESVEGAKTSATSCALCDLSFTNVEEQRSHVRTDLHGYNLKQKLRGLKSVNEQDFERLVGGMSIDHINERAQD